MSGPIFNFDAADPRMQMANAQARQTFKFFWRELYWESRRLLPALGMAVIKLPFTDGPRFDGNPEYEQMWVSDVKFDGSTLRGTLINEPNWLSSVSEGDAAEAPLSQLSDWMFTVRDQVYGAYTVNLMRSVMGAAERRQHDEAWGLDFGDPSVIRTEIEVDTTRKTVQPNQEPERRGAFKDHQACANMLGKIEEHFKADPSQANITDDRGWRILHNEALAGNLGIVRILVRYGADIGARTPEARSAINLARAIGWEEIASYLEYDAVKEAGSALRR